MYDELTFTRTMNLVFCHKLIAVQLESFSFAEMNNVRQVSLETFTKSCLDLNHQKIYSLADICNKNPDGYGSQSVRVVAGSSKALSHLFN
jgi:hypothetical protein